MKAIILAGGYAKRMWPMTKDSPKALLEIAGKPVINTIIEKMEKLNDVDIIFVSTNEKFKNDFETWKKTIKTRKRLVIVTEPTREEKGKLGAIGGIKFVLDTQKIEDDCIIMAADNLTGLKLNDAIGFWKKKNAPVVVLYDIKNLEEMKKFGEIKINENNKIISFIEKPQNPTSTLLSTGCYIYSKKTLKKIDEYLKSGGRPDSPGFFVQWLYMQEDVFGFVFDDFWFDIGDANTYEKAKKFLENKNNLT